MPVAAWFAELLKRELKGRVHLADSQVEQLHDHYELLERWNKQINLTSIRSGPEAVVRHYCESLFFAATLPATEKVRVTDLGSGAGFPGIPMAILKPAWSLWLIESHQRKAVFLKEATRKLSNVRVLAQRAEDVQELADWLVARAVDPSEVLKNLPRLAPQIGLMLGEQDFEECKTNPRIAWTDPIRLPWGDRRLCVYGVSRGT